MALGIRMSLSLERQVGMLIVNGDSTVRDILMKHATFDDISADKSLTATEYTRGQFWELSMKAAGALTRLGAGRGDRVLHVFSAKCDGAGGRSL